MTIRRSFGNLTAMHVKWLVYMDTGNINQAELAASRWVMNEMKAGRTPQIE